MNGVKMLYPWLPDEFRNSEFMQWLLDHGRWYVPLWLHFWSAWLFLTTAFGLARLTESRATARVMLLSSMLGMQLVLFIGTFALLDGGRTFYRMAIVPAIAALAFAAFFGAARTRTRPA